MAPLGYFDPAGFCKKGDEGGFRNLRAAEIKHGRVAMMAALGSVVQHYVKFPGFESVPSGLSAVLTPPGSYGMIALFLISGALELGVWTEDPSKEPGNFGDPLGLGQYDDEMRAREINNGRFAMFAAAGIIAAELVTGQDAVQQLGVAAFAGESITAPPGASSVSPLRAEPFTAAAAATAATKAAAAGKAAKSVGAAVGA